MEDRHGKIHCLSAHVDILWLLEAELGISVFHWLRLAHLRFLDIILLVKAWSVTYCLNFFKFLSLERLRAVIKVGSLELTLAKMVLNVIRGVEVLIVLLE